MINQPTGPTLLGFDVILVGTLLAGLAAFAVMLAIYAAVTIRDPMAKRVKALAARTTEGRDRHLVLEEAHKPCAPHRHDRQDEGQPRPS